MRMGRGTTPRRAISALVALGCVGGLGAGVTGCTARPGPTPTPTVTEEPTPSPTPTPTPTPMPDASVKPERPAAMDEVSAAGAEAVVVYFLQLFPYVYATGDLAEWVDLSHPECTFCAGVTEEVQGMVTVGQHSEGGLFEITASRSREVTPGYWYAVEVEFVQSPSTTVDSAGNIVESFPDTKPVWADAAVVYEGGHWLVRELTPRDGA